MRKTQLDLQWIDRHCIEQRPTCQIPCSHLHCRKKEICLNTMDLVYRLIRQPVALLGRPIESRYELGLLAKILRGKFISRNGQPPGFRLSEETPHSEVKEALALLSRITSDSWWKRAWIFQESYRAVNMMRLLIPHPTSLE